MPTPDDTALIPPLVRASTLPRSAHPTCPPEDDDITSSTDDNAILDESRGVRIRRNHSRSHSRPREEQQASAGVPEFSRAQTSRHHDGLWNSQSGAANSTSASDQKDDSSEGRERLIGSDMKPASPFPTPGPGTPTIRVRTHCCKLSHVTHALHSQHPSIPPHFYAMAVALLAHSSRIARYTACQWRLSMWI